MIADIENPQQPDRLGTDPLMMQEMMDYFQVPGVSLAIIHGFAIHSVKSWGLADVESGARANDDTLYQAASISKPVAAMASLRAVQEGRFGLDQDNQYDFEVPETARPSFPRRHAGHTKDPDEPLLGYR